VGPLNLRLLTQLIQKKVSLLDLDVIAQEEGCGQLKEGEKVNKNFNSIFLYSQTSDPGRRMTEDENIKIIFIHEGILTGLLFKIA
jgi:hypothetical protein